MMKACFALTLMAAACGSAWAQVPAEGVQMYGVVDVGVHRITGLKNGTSTQLASGIMDGSRLGFRGAEDLGGRYKAFFVLESRLEADNGTLSNRPASGTQLPDRLNTATLMGLPSALQPAVTAIATQLGGTVGVNLNSGFFDRQAFVGLITPVGAVLAGRQYTPAYEMAATLDTTNTQSSLAAGQLASLPAGFDIRVSNALAYRMELGGLTASAMYAFGETAGDSSANRLLGANVMYRTPDYSVGAAYNTRNNEKGEKSLTSAVFGGTLALGPGKASLLLASFKDDHPTGTSTIATALTTVNPALAGVAPLVQNAFNEGLKQDSRLYHVGYRFLSGASTIYVSYSKVDDRRPADADVASYGVAYTYAFSKRTDVNFVVSRYDNSKLSQAAPGGAGYLGGVTASAGTDSNSLALGVRHRF
ncbi:putative porin [Sphaerotilus hippei]|uniref:Putative porin n=1 Tax=Sphaerotilus hippei TaxID=744406 RepID=A0A318H6J0_9BURK|nr:porin [Sphaerotilus hippei]PXW95016.1 putative porin [Sphaerotilus hippei]